MRSFIKPSPKPPTRSPAPLKHVVTGKVPASDGRLRELKSVRIVTLEDEGSLADEFTLRLPRPAHVLSLPPGTKAQPLASSADATHDLLPLGFGACEFFVRQLLLARGSRFVELPLSSFVFNRGGRR